MSTPRILLTTALLSLLLIGCTEPKTTPEAEPETPPTAANTPDTRMPDTPQPNESQPNESQPNKPEPNESEPQTPAAKPRELATFGGGCFWCTEAVLEQLEGVEDVTSGYMGGHVDDPKYRAVCDGTTGHAEVVQVTFDPSVIKYETLLDWFFRSHDPTTLNRQGADVGTQYRSVIFTHSDVQNRIAIDTMNAIEHNFSDPIVTELTKAVKFWPAEDYHQDYFRNNPNQGYCRVVIRPKLEKLKLDTGPGR